jgi:hypothetical protein
MTKASLYINAKGYGVTRHSYSGSSEYNHCARLYYLKRIAGWSERKQSAAMQFGIAMEEAHREFHATGLLQSLAVFEHLWEKFKDNKELEYSDRNESWDALNLTGQELLRLYAIKYPKFDFTIPSTESFQVQRSYEVFPGSELAGIELISYMDIIGKLKAGRVAPDLKDDRVILDMKVSTAECPVLVALDPQLRTYSMVEEIPTVGFLWFKINSRNLKRGDEVTVLEQSGHISPGTIGYVLSEDKNDIPITPPSIYLVSAQKCVDDFEAIKGASKEAKAVREKFIADFGVIVPISAITRQEIEVRMATISDEGREDMRRQIEQDIIRIHHASEEDFWPQQGGVRFPNNKCVTCAMRGICSGNDKLRDELVMRIQEEII